MTSEQRRAQWRASKARRRKGEPSQRGNSPHGSYGAISAHRNAGEPLCDACRAFDAQRKRKAAPK